MSQTTEPAKRQRTRAELKKMTPEEIMAAYHAGELIQLMSEESPQ